MTASSVRELEIVRWKAEVALAARDPVAIEEPLEIRLRGQSLAVLMRTPGHDRELAAGFLVSEGLVRERAEILDIVFCGKSGEPAENNVDVLLAPGVRVDWERLRRHTFASSSCGVCGKATIAAVRAHFPPLPEMEPVLGSVIARLPEQLRDRQAGFSASGGLHASGLFTDRGDLHIVREDVGRHNALDKVIGWAFFAERLPLRGLILVVSGRISLELMQKALAAGIGCVAGISAPTSLAVEFARENGQTLVGFVREGRMNVYAGTLAPEAGRTL